MRVNMVHAGSVPGTAVGNEDRRFFYLMLFIYCGGEFGDFEGSDLLAVSGIAILGEAKQTAVVIEHATAGPGDAFVARDDGAGRMLSPWGSGIVHRIKSQRVM